MVTLTRTKRRDGRVQDAHTLTLSAVLGTGSAVLEARDGADLTNAQTTLLTVFRSGFSTTGGTRAQLREAAQMPSASFHRALNDLLKAGQLTNEGTLQRPFYRLASP